METEAAQATPRSDYDGDTDNHDQSVADKKQVSVFSHLLLLPVSLTGSWLVISHFYCNCKDELLN